MIDYTPTVDIEDVDPDEMVGRKSPYDDPETDDARSLVARRQSGAGAGANQVGIV
jgi:hypothetical protein